MSLRAYQQAAQRAEDPRSTEYRLLGQVTRRLMEVQELGRSDIRALVDALDWNRRVWNTFAADCAAPGNGLPDALRAGIVSLAIFVSKHTSAVTRGVGDIEVLIEINRDVMQGLEASARAARQPA